MPDLVAARDALEDMAVIIKVSEKSIASVTRRFQIDLRNIVKAGFTSGSSILADTRRLVKDAVGDAYVEGLKEGGVPFDEMTSDDAMQIVELTDQQTSYVTDFVRATREAKNDKAKQRDILDNRISLWTASIEAVGVAGLASAKANEMVTWKLGATEEHCRTCNQLNGQSHRRKWFASRDYFPGKPGAAMDCGGFNCLCQLR